MCLPFRSPVVCVHYLSPYRLRLVKIWKLNMFWFLTVLATWCNRQFRLCRNTIYSSQMLSICCFFFHRRKQKPDIWASWDPTILKQSNFTFARIHAKTSVEHLISHNMQHCFIQNREHTPGALFATDWKSLQIKNHEIRLVWIQASETRGLCASAMSTYCCSGRQDAGSSWVYGNKINGGLTERTEAPADCFASH